MDITLHVNSSERQAISKSLDSGTVLSGSLRNESSVINPSFLIEYENPTGFNYCYIADFGRYYFITNITSIRTNIWRIDCTVDVLMSFSSEILNLDVIVNYESSPDDESYMNGEPWQSLVKTRTDVINFPYGLLDDGEYILITSGGIAS